nr:TolC family protein [Luteimonas huabeiensis]
MRPGGGRLRRHPGRGAARSRRRRAGQAARALDAQLETLDTALAAAREAFDLAASRYRAGIGTQLDVLAAQRPLFELEQRQAGLRAQRLAAAADLDRALGGGLELAAAPHTPPPHIETAAP